MRMLLNVLLIATRLVFTLERVFWCSGGGSVDCGSGCLGEDFVQSAQPELDTSYLKSLFFVTFRGFETAD